MSKKKIRDEHVEVTVDKIDADELSPQEKKLIEKEYKKLVKEWGGVYMTEQDVLDKLYKFAEDEKMPTGKFRHERFIAQEIMPMTNGVMKRLFDDLFALGETTPEGKVLIDAEKLPSRKAYVIMFSKGITQIMKEHVKTEVKVETGKMKLMGWLKKIRKPHKLK